MLLKNRVEIDFNFPLLREVACVASWKLSQVDGERLYSRGSMISESYSTGTRNGEAGIKRKEIFEDGHSDLPERHL